MLNKLKTRLYNIYKGVIGITRKEWAEAYTDLEEEYGVLATKFDALVKELNELKKPVKKAAVKKTAKKK